MNEFSVLIGGKAGFGIDRSGALIGSLLNRLGYRIYIYRDYPSLIRGGHTFSIIRASGNRIAAHQDKVDIILAMDQETLDLHRGRLKNNCLFIFDTSTTLSINLERNRRVDADKVKPESGDCGIGLALGKFLKEEGAPEIMRNTCIIAAFAKAAGIGFNFLEDVLKKEFPKDLDLNLKVARRGFNEAKELIKITAQEQESLALLTGNQAIALGLLKAGLDAYIAYPMTPSSPILHYLAEIAGDFGLDVLHPESEISVILTALGYSFAGKRAAVGTSGGGFCLMTEGLSFAAMAELPVVIVLGQRPGPSTGLPTYSAQTELYFALNAGQGEFTRFIAAPGDAEEAYYWSAVSLNMSWKYQIPCIILSDKDMGEGVFDFDINAVKDVKMQPPVSWYGKPPYKRYLVTESGVSPLAFPPLKDAVIKVNSYEHDESGITTEEPQTTVRMQDKRLRKEKLLVTELESLKCVNTYAGKNPETAIVCWGSNKGPCVEVGRKLGLKVIQPVVLNPFPLAQFREALSAVKKIICVENNATGQLAGLIKGYGFNADKAINKYDGRPFSVEELENKVREAAG